MNEQEKQLKIRKVDDYFVKNNVKINVSHILLNIDIPLSKDEEYYISSYEIELWVRKHIGIEIEPFGFSLFKTNLYSSYRIIK